MTYLGVPYSPVYNVHPCIMHTPILNGSHSHCIYTGFKFRMDSHILYLKLIIHTWAKNRAALKNYKAEVCHRLSTRSFLKTTKFISEKVTSVKIIIIYSFLSPYVGIMYLIL